MEIEISEVTNLDAEWKELVPLLRGLHDHHLTIMEGRLREDWEERQRAAIEDQFVAGEAVMMVAKSEGRVVGLVHGHITEHLVLEDRIGFVDHAYVLPEARRQSVLSALLERLERRFRELGADGAQLYVVAGNAEATTAWKAKGYRVYMERMRKELD